MTDLTAISTFGWYTSDGYEVDLLTSVSTFGWYGLTLEELIDFFKTVDFGLIIDQAHALGLEIEVVHELGNFPITTEHNVGDFRIDQLFRVTLRR